jgi:hypothetical protein
MKPSTKTLLAFGCAYAITATSLFAQLYTFDENGNSTGPGISPGVMSPDPSGGLTVPVLVYTLPFPVVPGDVGLLENGSTSQSPSDLVRFVSSPATGNISYIIFYSDVETPGSLDLADTGLPPSPNAIIIPEAGTEAGPNGATWTPAPGAPGSPLSGVSVAYQIISDVPEPNAVALVAIGGGLLLYTLKRRQQASN